MGNASREGSLRERLLAVGEELLAREGIDNVSLRQIGKVAGSTNPYAVQYHFGDKIGLISAIYAQAQVWLEARRGKLLEDALRLGRTNDLRTLVDIMLRPLAEFENGRGQRVFARLLWQVRSPQQLVENSQLPGHGAHAVAILAMMQDTLPHLTPAVFQARRVGTTYLFLSTLVADDVTRPGADREDREAVIDDALAMVAAALGAPAARHHVADARPAHRAPQN